MTPPKQQDKPIDLEALRLAAEAATPGIWERDANWRPEHGGAYIRADFKVVCSDGSADGEYCQDLNEADATHIAAFNPATALALLDLIDAQQKQIAERDTKLREAVGIVCEGWTLPDGARKTLEAALWANP